MSTPLIFQNKDQKTTVDNNQPNYSTPLIFGGSSRPRVSQEPALSSTGDDNKPENIITKAMNFFGNIFKPKNETTSPAPVVSKLNIAGGGKNNLQNSSLNLKLDDKGNIVTSSSSNIPSAIGTEVISAGTPVTTWDKIKGILSKPFMASDEEKNARAGVAVALRNSISTKYDIPVDQIDLSKISNNMDDYTKELGVRTQLNGKEFVDLMFALTAPLTLAAPAVMVKGLIGFTAVSAVTDPIYAKVRDSMSENGVSSSVLDFMDLVDLSGKMLATHGLLKASPKVGEMRDFFLKQKLKEYKLPETLSLDGKQVQDIYQTGKMTTVEQKELYAALKMNSAQIKQAITTGVKINVPTIEVIKITDRPWYSKVKGLFGIPESTPIVKTNTNAPVTRAPAGLLTAGEGSKTSINVIPPVDVKAPVQPAQLPSTVNKPVLEGGPIKLVGLPTVFTKDVLKYVNSSDFAESLPGTSSDASQIGLMDPKNIIPRDTVDTKYVESLVKRLNSGEELPPVILEKGKNGALQTMDGANRLTAYQQVNKQIPVIYNGKDAISGLHTVKEVYTSLSESKAPKIFNKPIEVPTTKVPVPLKPVGEGEIKVSTLGVGVEQKALENKLISSLSDLPQYKQVSMKDQSEKAIDLMLKDFEKAKRIALGQENSPEGLIPEAVFKAVEDKATLDGSVELINQLAHSSLVGEATAMGQRIRTLGERDPDSPVSVIKELIEARKQALEKKLGREAKGAVKNTVKQIKDKIAKPNKYDWAKFIESIEC